MNISSFIVKCGCVVALCSPLFTAQAADEYKVMRIYEKVVFYDGYKMKDLPEGIEEDGILRHFCYLYSKKLSDDLLNSFGEKLELKVTIGALCDNYDRIGNINIAFVPKGMETYDPDEVERIEIGRFITPFMNKNIKPNEVPYSYNVPYLSPVFRDASLREKYDMWLEFEVFGVPYAANTQVQGCGNRSDVFAGTLDFHTSEPALPLTDNNVLVPIKIKNPEYQGGNLNNYQESATDELGKTEKTYTFEVPCDVEDGQIVLVTSNHGANSGGEEYNRRWHYVYYDGKIAYEYMPGRDSCEPFRKYNTQSNGIYGRTPMSDQDWQTFSNWCPGDVIDNRIINLGPVKAGTHSIKISVPRAKFKGGQGDIPVSLFFQGAKSGELPVTGMTPIEVEHPSVEWKLINGTLTYDSEVVISSIYVYDEAGHLVLCEKATGSHDLNCLSAGVYVVAFALDNNIIETHKIAL